MNRRMLSMLLGGTVILLPFIACAQQRATGVMGEVNCDSLPAGPARTDCYIGLSRISRQKVEIAAGVAQQLKDTARYRRVTGQQRKIRTHVRKRNSAN